MTDDLKERLRTPWRDAVSKCADVGGADLSNVLLTYERIWLQSDGGDGATWCQHPQDDEDVPYVRADFYAASLARITELEVRLAAADKQRRESDEKLTNQRHEINWLKEQQQALKDSLAAAEADRDKAREYAAQARIRENKAEDARVSAEVRALRAEAGEDALAGALRGAMNTLRDASRQLTEDHRGVLKCCVWGQETLESVSAALAAYEARRKG